MADYGEFKGPGSVWWDDRHNPDEHFKTTYSYDPDEHFKTTYPYDPVRHPQHYQDTEVFCPACNRELETIDIIKNKGYILGNILKYLFRYAKKGSPQQDLQKAKEYIDMLLEAYSENK